MFARYCATKSHHFQLGLDSNCVKFILFYRDISSANGLAKFNARITCATLISVIS